jgi:hypothetical protein
LINLIFISFQNKLRIRHLRAEPLSPAKSFSVGLDPLLEQVGTIFVKQSNIGSADCSFDIRLYLTTLGQARKYIETCGT